MYKQVKKELPAGRGSLKIKGSLSKSKKGHVKLEEESEESYLEPVNLDADSINEGDTTPKEMYENLGDGGKMARSDSTKSGSYIQMDKTLKRSSSGYVEVLPPTGDTVVKVEHTVAHEQYQNVFPKIQKKKLFSWGKAKPKVQDEEEESVYDIPEPKTSKSYDEVVAERRISEESGVSVTPLSSISSKSTKSRGSQNSVDSGVVRDVKQRPERSRPRSSVFYDSEEIQEPADYVNVPLKSSSNTSVSEMDVSFLEDRDRGLEPPKNRDGSVSPTPKKKGWGLFGKGKQKKKILQVEEKGGSDSTEKKHGGLLVAVEEMDAKAKGKIKKPKKRKEKKSKGSDSNETVGVYFDSIIDVDIEGAVNTGTEGIGEGINNKTYGLLQPEKLTGSTLTSNRSATSFDSNQSENDLDPDMCEPVSPLETLNTSDEEEVYEPHSVPSSKLVEDIGKPDKNKALEISQSDETVVNNNDIPIVKSVSNQHGEADDKPTAIQTNSNQVISHSSAGEVINEVPTDKDETCAKVDEKTEKSRASRVTLDVCDPSFVRRPASVSDLEENKSQTIGKDMKLMENPPQNSFLHTRANTLGAIPLSGLPTGPPPPIPPRPNAPKPLVPTKEETLKENNVENEKEVVGPCMSDVDKAVDSSEELKEKDLKITPPKMFVNRPSFDETSPTYKDFDEIQKEQENQKDEMEKQELKASKFPLDKIRRQQMELPPLPPEATERKSSFDSPTYKDFESIKGYTMTRAFRDLKVMSDDKAHEDEEDLYESLDDIQTRKQSLQHREQEGQRKTGKQTQITWGEVTEKPLSIVEDEEENEYEQFSPKPQKINEKRRPSSLSAFDVPIPQYLQDKRRASSVKSDASGPYDVPRETGRFMSRSTSSSSQETKEDSDTMSISSLGRKSVDVRSDSEWSVTSIGKKSVDIRSDSEWKQEEVEGLYEEYPQNLPPPAEPPGEMYETFDDIKEKSVIDNMNNDEKVAEKNKTNKSKEKKKDKSKENEKDSKNDKKLKKMDKNDKKRGSVVSTNTDTESVVSVESGYEKADGESEKYEYLDDLEGKESMLEPEERCEELSLDGSSDDEDDDDGSDQLINKKRKKKRYYYYYLITSFIGRKIDPTIK